MTGFGDFATAEAVAERGQNYYSHGQYDEAWAVFNHAVELSPHFVWAICGRGEANRMLGRYAKVVRLRHELLHHWVHYSERRMQSPRRWPHSISLNLACQDHCPGVSATLTTIAFDDSSLRWLETGT